MTEERQPAHRRFANSRVIIMSAPNGARRMPLDHAALPLTPEQIGECACSLVEQSVSILHLHVRDDQQNHTLSAERYRQAMASVRAAVGDALLVQVTTEAVGRYRPDEQMEVVRDLRPEAVSLALRELCPNETAEPEAGRFFEWLVKERIWPQYILYSANDVARFDDLRRRGFFADDRPFTMLVLGQYAAGRAGEVSELDDLLSAADCDQFPWAVCCFGRNENAAAMRAVATGGHVRLGFENNVVLQDGSTAKDNAALIAQFHASREDTVRVPARVDEIRNQWLTA